MKLAAPLYSVRVAGTSACFTYLSNQCELLPQQVLDGFLGAIAVRFIGQKHQPHRAAVAANRLIHALALDRERAGVVVRLAVDQQDRDP